MSHGYLEDHQGVQLLLSLLDNAWYLLEVILVVV